MFPSKFLIFIASELLGAKTEESKTNYILNHFSKKKKKLYTKSRWVQVTPGVTSQESHLFGTIDLY